jgi:hypothetical protein
MKGELLPSNPANDAVRFFSDFMRDVKFLNSISAIRAQNSKKHLTRPRKPIRRKPFQAKIDADESEYANSKGMRRIRKQLAHF